MLKVCQVKFDAALICQNNIFFFIIPKFKITIYIYIYIYSISVASFQIIFNFYLWNIIKSIVKKKMQIRKKNY